MDSVADSFKGEKIAGGLSIPVALLHPTKSGIDRQWTGFIHRVYRSNSEYSPDKIVFSGIVVSEASDTAWQKIMYPSLSQQVVDGRTGAVVADVEDWLMKMIANSQG